MILFIKISPEREEALLAVYSSIKYAINKTISDVADKIIIERAIYVTDKDLEESYEQYKLCGCGPNRKRIVSQATKDKISKTLKEKYKGEHYPLFKETKALIGLIHKGKVLSQETKDAIGKGNRGQKRTEKQRENIGKAHKGLKYKKRVQK